MIHTHVISNKLGRSSIWGKIIKWSYNFRIFFTKFLFCEILNKSCKTFIHPCPLSFITVYNHRKKVMTYFMYDYSNHSKFFIIGIWTINVGSSKIETYHWIFHTNLMCVDRNCFMIRVIESIFWKWFKSFNHRYCWIILPQWVSLSWINWDCHNIVISNFHCHHI